MTHAQDERAALAALLDEAGPDAPTLCAGWQTGDLAAHLVLRERRPDAGVGMAGGPLAGYTERLRQQFLERYSFGQLVTLFRSGPPRLSPFAIPGADELANAVEYFVHHEDVRRAGRAGPSGRSARAVGALWRRLKGARLMLRSRPDRGGAGAGARRQADLIVAKNGGAYGHRDRLARRADDVVDGAGERGPRHVGRPARGPVAQLAPGAPDARGTGIAPGRPQ